MRVVITGATGFIGTRLVEKLHGRGDRLTLLVRDPDKAQQQFPADVFTNLAIVAYTPLQLGEWTNVFGDCDGVVNLAGAPIFGQRWSDKVKKAILESRQIGTRRIIEAIKTNQHKPTVLVNGSAIGFYGTDPDKEFDEYSFSGDDFLAEVCKAWEAEADVASELGLRVVKLRTGIVMGNGGALAKLLPIFQLGAGGKIGNGKQWFSWIHRDDLVDLIMLALDNTQITGSLNGTAPNPVTNAEFTKTLAKAVAKPALLPVPAIALQVILGEASILVLEGQKVLPKKALHNKFSFTYPELEPALMEIVGK
ncbi:protein of unknown function DUF1731 [Thalassoporum mexicanum PCC 7367]|uniref:thylakoid membrane protein ThyD n=1 Tax=Thalassoporum mexicanum TaxID=3457544 RepID=UPI00029FB0E5|nr:TIGR01777 family oxidoreductase [Pseudanabaena sp. PCC 7367]AFY71420.1 protein of unknown function DUF1731 [Pseudanabaena sp. PCC 7367]